MKSSLTCPLCNVPLDFLGSHGIVDYENRWDAEASKYLCSNGHIFFLTDVEEIAEEVDIDNVATRESMAEARDTFVEILNELKKSQERYNAGKDINNNDRRWWIQLSLRMWSALTGDTTVSWEENIQNLLTDLLHFCKQKRIDFFKLLEEAQANYADEEAEEVLETHSPKESAPRPLLKEDVPNVPKRTPRER